VPVVSGVTAPEPREVIREVCRRQGCRLAELGVDFDFDYRPPRGLESAPALGTVDFRRLGPQARPVYRDLSLGLLGRHQGANAALALAAIVGLREAGWTVPDEAVRAGLVKVVWPARIELLARRPAVVVDGAHNRASVEALIETLQQSFSVRRRLAIFGTTRDKDVRGMLGPVLSGFDEVILTQYTNNPRAVPVEELAAAAAELGGRNYLICPTPQAAWDEATRLATPGDLVCITGSLFLAAQMRPLVLGSL